MTTPIITHILRTSALAFEIALPKAKEEGMQPELQALSSMSSSSRRIAPLLTNGLWAVAQHAVSLDRDASTMALCALLASRMVRFSATRMLSVRGRKTA